MTRCFRILLRPRFGMVVLLLLLSCSLSFAQDFEKKVFFIEIRPDISLEIVEWGGQGKPLIFLAGLGHAAHVFDDFAPRFCREFRVLGITRRGFGASTLPKDGYDLATLAEDIKIVLDSLRLDAAILVGHSLGGDEMTKFARLFPERVEALIYLEAAYDRVMARDSMMNYPDPPSNVPEPTEEDLASIASFREYYFRANGVKLPESEFLAICGWNPDGSWKDWRAPGWVYKAASEGLEHPDYTGINVPALAIYGVNYPITELYMDYNEQDSTIQSQMMVRYMAARKFDKLSRDQFGQNMKNGQVVEIENAGHSLYLTHADKTEKAMWEFLDKLKK